MHPTRSRNRRGLSVLALFCLLVSSFPAMAAELWSPQPNTGLQLDHGLLEDLFAKRSQEFSIDVGGREHQVSIVSTSSGEIGVRSLRGIVDGDPESFFLFCSSPDGASSGFFHPSGDGSYRLIWKDGAYRLEEVEAEEYTPCAGAVRPSGISPRPAGTPFLPTESPRSDRALADDGSRHDVLVAYTPQTRNAAGGDSFIQAEIQLAVDSANMVYGNSGVSSELRLVHCVFTDYIEVLAWSYGSHLDALIDPDDGQMDELLDLRDRTGADFLSLIIENTDMSGNPLQTCGIAYVMSAEFLGPEFEQAALSVVTRRCASSFWSFAHELGHNRGCAHNREDSDNDGAYSYSFGHRFTGDDELGYRTVMAYDNANEDFARIPNFSNPNRNHQGQPTGVPVGQADEAHCALTHENTNAICAGFRDEHTFVDFDWTGASTGFIDAPYPDIATGIGGSRVGGTLTLTGEVPVFLGLFPSDHRVYVHDGAGSSIFGSP